MTSKPKPYQHGKAAMKMLKNSIDTAFLIAYTMVIFYGGWLAHEKLYPFLEAAKQVQTIQNHLPGFEK
jgi:hypothetical protein